ncbi:bifunctional 4-hydroxy-2-oxoglutarate aldolase/2-dehydro-3-deoxy-phosphogluconate aldolase [Neomegalonema sp.]|uniref:bifunctional 4-hydroxy-2-oxoglutarate aldolase/2-dehydro-3-deoxy-phosphogluconate aldolase n=1 Tax=Neomegalonema sp. TaxID=2039713 RepID=UPI00261EBA2B|nr:bifunctional 4-hydroxy-2-oxoglutarate aldolase/2-dehydro-3-deoxy-phosphogluconate aldolase [Neomegalonema sp.]MDD2869509.1 bifunctional 4-hydroxy-2-oxoglutarate aldolase/2-dehydro-3-deoxy-phosphogluconate aldolase [Neomegalonema sp.]
MGKMVSAREVLALAPVVPVLIVETLAEAEPLGRALVKGGLKALEVTLRTPVALDAIRAMSAIEGAVVGAGTLLTPADVKAAKAAGARFGVSPGCTETLLKAARDEGLPLLPGAVTASEVMRLLEQGLDVLKFFPAEQSGGAALLKAWSSPLPQVKFCPTGGISLANAAQYLDLPNVLAVGGSWVAPRAAVKAGDWARIEELAREASGLRRAV